MKKTYDVMILNQKFSLKTDQDEKHVKRVADYVNKKMHEIVTQNRATATANVAILAAINIADDFFQMKTKQQTQSQNWLEKLQGLLEQVEKIH